MRGIEARIAHLYTKEFANAYMDERDRIAEEIASCIECPQEDWYEAMITHKLYRRYFFLDLFPLVEEKKKAMLKREKKI